jgi:hypothetical protein
MPVINPDWLRLIPGYGILALMITRRDVLVSVAVMALTLIAGRAAARPMRSWRVIAARRSKCSKRRANIAVPEPLHLLGFTEQFVQCALSLDAPILEDDDLLGTPEGGPPM